MVLMLLCGTFNKNRCLLYFDLLANIISKVNNFSHEVRLNMQIQWHVPINDTKGWVFMVDFAFKGSIQYLIWNSRTVVAP